MGGAVKNIVSTPKNIMKSPTRAFTAIGTGGMSELARLNPAVNQIGNALDSRVDGLFGRNNNPNLPSLQGGQSATDLLANTGGAPVLANIVMGVDPEEAIAGFLGKNTKDGSWDEFKSTLSQKDMDAINSTLGQLKTIQSNVTLRNQAVEKVIADFPNITKQVAQDRANAGVEFDEVTKGYMKQALEGTAAKYAAGGNLSSGAANEAFTRVGAENGMNKLNYMGDRENSSYQQNMQGFNMRLAEANALRDFQNTMIAGKVSEGFNANQANLGRIQQGNQFNMQMSENRYLQGQQTNAALTGAALGGIASLGGSYLGASMLSKQIAAGNPTAPTPQVTTKNITAGIDNNYSRGY